MEKIKDKNEGEQLSKWLSRLIERRERFAEYCEKRKENVPNKDKKMFYGIKRAEILRTVKLFRDILIMAKKLEDECDEGYKICKEQQIEINGMKMR